MSFFTNYYSPFGASGEIGPADTQGALQNHEKRLRKGEQDLSSMYAQLVQQHEQATQGYEQLRLVCNALISLLEMKKVLKREELDVLMQQLDLLDGVEDQRQRELAWEQAPRCQRCQHFINPARTKCVYCGHRIAKQAGQVTVYRGHQPRQTQTAPQVATCPACATEVERHTMRFTGEGELLCGSCHHGRLKQRLSLLEGTLDHEPADEG